MIKSVVDERAVASGVRCLGVSHIAIGDGAVHNVRGRCRDVVKDGLVDAKVLGENTLGGMSEPVVDVEGGSTRRLAIEVE